MSLVDSTRSIHCIKGEIYNMLSSMRMESNWESNSRFYREIPLESETPLSRMFINLNEELIKYETIKDLDPMVYLTPFLELIRNPNTSATLTRSALSSVEKFILYGFITKETKNISTVINELALSLTLCTFESTYTTTEESLFLKLLDVILQIIRNEASLFLTHQTLIELFKTCYKMATVPSSNPLLQLSAENTLSHFLMCFFSYLHYFINEESIHEDPEPSSTQEDKSTDSASSPTESELTPVRVPFSMETYQYILTFLSEMLNPSQPINIRILGFSLINIIIEMAGEYINLCPQLIKIIQTTICKYIIINSEIDDLKLLSISLRVIYNLFQACKFHLKIQLEVFFVSIYLRNLNSASTNPAQKELILESLLDFFREPSLILDLYTNYDCDVQCTNLFEQLFHSLINIATPSLSSTNSSSFNSLNSLGVQALLNMINCIALRCHSNQSITPIESGLEENVLNNKRMKYIYHQFSDSFNKKQYEEAIQYAISEGLLSSSDDAKGMAKLIYECPYIDKSILGDYISYDKERKPFNALVRYYFVRLFNYDGLSVDDILRTFLGSFRIPGEAQAIDRVLDDLATYVYSQYPGPFLSSDCLFRLLFSCLILNTDLHNPGVKNKMTLEGFLRNNEGINNDENLPVEYLTTLYNNIKEREIIIYESDVNCIDINRWEEALNNKEQRIQQGQFTHDVNVVAGNCEKEMFKLVQQQWLEMIMIVLFSTKDHALIQKIMVSIDHYAQICDYYQFEDLFTQLYNKLYNSMVPLFKSLSTTTTATTPSSAKDTDPYDNPLFCSLLQTFLSLVLHYGNQMKSKWIQFFDFCYYLNLFLCDPPVTFLEDISSPTHQHLPSSLDSLQQELYLNNSKSSYAASTFMETKSFFSFMFKDDANPFPEAFVNRLRALLKEIHFDSIFLRSDKLKMDVYQEFVTSLCSFKNDDPLYISSLLSQCSLSLEYKYVSTTYLYRVHLLYLSILHNEKRIETLWPTIYSFLQKMIQLSKDYKLHYVLQSLVVYVFALIKHFLTKSSCLDYIYQLFELLFLFPSSIYVLTRRVSGLYFLLSEAIPTTNMTFWDYYFSLLQYDLASKETQSLVWYCLCQLLESRMVSVYNYGFMNNLLLHSQCNYTTEWIKPLIDFLFSLLVYSTTLTEQPVSSESPSTVPCSVHLSSESIRSRSHSLTNASPLHTSSTPRSPPGQYSILSTDQCWLLTLQTFIQLIEDPKMNLDMVQYMLSKLQIAFQQLPTVAEKSVVPSDSTLYEAFQTNLFQLLTVSSTSSKYISMLFSFYSKCFLFCFHRLVLQKTFHLFWLRLVTQFTKICIHGGMEGETALELFKNMIRVMKTDHGFEEAFQCTGQNILGLTWSIVDSMSPDIRKQMEKEDEEVEESNELHPSPLSN